MHEFSLIIKMPRTSKTSKDPQDLKIPSTRLIYCSYLKKVKFQREILTVSSIKVFLRVFIIIPEAHLCILEHNLQNNTYNIE